MNKFKKKLLGALGLLAVITMTFVAATIPSGSAHATSGSVPITVFVDGSEEHGPFSARLTSPSNGSEIIGSVGSLGVSYANAASLTITMFGPDGSSTTLYNGPVANLSGSFSIPYKLTHGFGDYSFGISGVDLDGASKSGPSVTIHYHSAFPEVLPNPNEEEDPTVKIVYGPEVCGVRFKIVSVDDPSRAPTYYPALDEAPMNCKTEDKNGDGVLEVVVPMSELDLDAGEYQIFVTTYGCTAGNDPDAGNVIESDLPAGSLIFDPEDEYVPPVTPPEVPDTGSVRIGGLVVARKDLILTGIIAAVAVAGIYFAKKNKQQIKY